MVLRFLKICVVMLLAGSVGLSWNLLQVVAWGSMLMKYSQSGSFMTALEMTFDGENPCDICKVVEQAKGESKDAPALEVETHNVQLFLEVSTFYAFRLPECGTPAVQNKPLLDQEANPPPTPPPIRA